MRVLHLIPSLGGGGAERQLTYLARELVDSGISVHVGLCRGGTNLTRLERSGASIHWIRSSGSYDPLLLPRAIALVRAVKPDLVQTWITQMDVIGGLAAIATQTPWIVSERSAAAEYPRDVRHFLRRQLGRFASAVIANSPGGFGCWRPFSGRSFVVPNAVPFEEIDAAGACETLAKDERSIVLFAGRFDHEKNLSILIRALEPVVARGNVLALLCGTGPLEKEVRKQVTATRYPDRIRLLGYSENLQGIMRCADVLVSASLFEGHPNVIIEAVASGCPVVVSDIPAHRAILDSTTALFVPADDPQAISRAIMEALDDEQGSRRRSERARNAIEHLTAERMGREYVSIYAEILRVAEDAANTRCSSP